MQAVESLVICLLSFMLALVPLATASYRMGDSDGKLEENVPSSIMKEKDLQHTKYMRPSEKSELRRHIRSVDQQGSPQSTEGFDTDENIQSNPVSDDDSDLAHKTPRSFVSSDMLQQFTPNNLLSQQERPYGLHRWYLGGAGPFSRGVRPDRAFIRFGRTSGFDSFTSGGMNSNSNPNKKNNFIRLGRENPRRNNFIRLGRSGVWGNNERLGSKIGYFPDYYSQLPGVNPNLRNFADLPPLPFDPNDVHG